MPAQGWSAEPRDGARDVVTCPLHNWVISSETGTAKGFTAASAMAASLGVSLTHRDFAQSVRFVTGRGKCGALPHDLDWRGLSDPATTLIVYMGGRTICDFARRLIEEGLPDHTAAVTASAVSRQEQSVHRTTLGALATSLCPIGDTEARAGFSWYRSGLLRASQGSLRNRRAICDGVVIAWSPLRRDEPGAEACKVTFSQAGTRHQPGDARLRQQE